MACVGTVSVQSTFTLMSCPCGGGGVRFIRCGWCIQVSCRHRLGQFTYELSFVLSPDFVDLVALARVSNAQSRINNFFKFKPVSLSVWISDLTSEKRMNTVSDNREHSP